jgi:tetratricopeptide (TPR) repeat protein
VTDASDQCSIVGTEGYLPPEGPGTPQADIFALGKVLYEAAMGMDRRELPKLPKDLRSWSDAGLVLELNEIVLRACAADTADRYRTAQEMLDDLARLGQGRSVMQHRIWRRRLETARRIGVVAVAIALAAAGGVFVWQTLKRSAPVMLVDETGQALGLHDTKAAQAYKLGLSALRRGTPTDVGLATNYFNTVIEAEPAFVNAYARLFETYLMDEDHGGPAIPGKTEMLNKLSVKLQEIAPTNAETHAAIAIVRFLDEWRWKDAETEFKEALRIDPNCRMALTYYGYFLTRLCRGKEARAVLDRADTVDLGSADIAKLLGHCDYANRHFEEALNHYLDAEERKKDYASAYYWAGRANMGMTNYFEALRQLHKHEVLVGYDDASNAARYDNYRKAVEKDPEHPAHAYWSAVIEDLKQRDAANSMPYLWAARYVRVGDQEQAQKWLKTAIDQHDVGMENLLFDECWDPYHREKWFQDIAKKVGLEPWL